MRPIWMLALVLIVTAAAAEEQKAVPSPDTGTDETTTPAASAEPTAANSDSRFKTMDRLELDTTSITGNQELPKVMYVVPWKKAELGDLSGKPARSLIDEILAPVDRDVFRREVGYFETLAGESGDPAAQGENPVTPETARP